MPEATLVKPLAPHPGSAIALVTPSSSAGVYRRRLARAIRSLTELGFRPVLAPNALWTETKRPEPQTLADDLSWSCQNDDVSAIICTTGGLRSAELLPHLDYNLLRAARKPLCGFSDITSLLLGVHVHADMVTFHGPTLLSSMGDADGIDPYTTSGLLEAWNTSNSRVLSRPSHTSVESPVWDIDDHRPRTRKPANPWRSITPGSGSGRLIGGHLGTLVSLVDTEYLPSAAGRLLFLETNETAASVIENELSTLAFAGLFDEVVGLIFGRTLDVDRPDALRGVLQSIAQQYRFPAISGVDIGHTVPIATLPIGVLATLDADRTRIRFDEGAVVSRGESFP